MAALSAEFRILPDRGLVNISTYRPSSREEYVLLQGLSDGSFERYGETFLGEVRKYYCQEKVTELPPIKG
ncbi:MAG: HRDC domain-containing protein [Bacteroidales bacterium]|nr:HRDC domain-containing protein [Bacteroidales bacterium]